MKQVSDPERVKLAGLAISRYFEMIEGRRAQAGDVIAFGRRSGLRKAEIKAARKPLGVKSSNENGEYWWEWPENVSPGEINRQLSKEVLEHARERN